MTDTLYMFIMIVFTVIGACVAEWADTSYNCFLCDERIEILKSELPQEERNRLFDEHLAKYPFKGW